uniref:Uncharacterized protein n=1 Tax=viral metagenome TaxID=1070528 RepID=A0A6H2A122_9ZZZZ
MTILTNKERLQKIAGSKSVCEYAQQAYKERLIDEMDRKIVKDIIVDIEELVQEVKKLIPEGKSRAVAIEKLLQVKDHIKDAVNPEGEYSYNTLTWHRCPQCKNLILVELFFNKMNKNYRYICPSCGTNVVVVVGDSKDDE